jgi:hypothetical protein
MFAERNLGNPVDEQNVISCPGTVHPKCYRLLLDRHVGNNWPRVMSKGESDLT